VLTILWIGLFAGTLDITGNLIFNQLRGITPKIVFQYIASGLIGLQAFRGGLASVALGVAIHYTIALIWTAVFYAASRKLAILSRGPVLCGLVYGGAIYLLMNFIVRMLSGVPHRTRQSPLLRGSTVCWLFYSLLDYHFTSHAAIFERRPSHRNRNWDQPSRRVALTAVGRAL
jgi:NADH:ubiquinone oxidoreductase subunit 6 (subunit J)